MGIFEELLWEEKRPASRFGQSGENARVRRHPPLHRPDEQRRNLLSKHSSPSRTQGSRVTPINEPRKMEESSNLPRGVRGRAKSIWRPDT